LLEQQAVDLPGGGNPTRWDYIPNHKQHLSSRRLDEWFERFQRIILARFCVAMDQLLGREAGRVVNDEAVTVAVGARSPELAVQALEESWSQNRI
jgi:hypothetical protein